MKKLRNIILLAAVLLGTGEQGLMAQTAQMPAYSATAVLNQYIAENAGKYPAWQRDIVIEQGNVSDVSRRVIPPRRVGVSPVAGIYSYRPITWDELGKADKLAVLRDPKLLTWVSWYKSKGRLTVPREIGTPLTTNPSNKTAANTAYRPTTATVASPEQVSIPPIEQTPYYAEIAQKNHQAQAEQQKRAFEAQARYQAYVQELRNLSHIVSNTSNTAPNTVAQIAMPPAQQPTIPVVYSAPQAIAPQPLYNPAYNAGQATIVPVTPITPMPHAGAGSVPTVQPAYSTTYPEYDEILKLRGELLRDSVPLSDVSKNAPGYVPNDNTVNTAPTSAPSTKLSPVVPVAPDMGKYQIKINTGDLYSEDPLYYQLKASQ